MKKMGWDISHVFQVLEDTVDAAFAPEHQKDLVRKEIQKYKAEPNLAPNPFFNDRVQYSA